MCRYGLYGPYKAHWACFECRKVYRRKSGLEGGPAPCPQCAKPMFDMGMEFKAPPKTDLKQWEKVRILAERGFTYHSCGCCGPGLRPAELSEVAQFLEKNTPMSAGKKLLTLISERVGQRTKSAARSKKKLRSVPASIFSRQARKR